MVDELEIMQDSFLFQNVKDLLFIRELFCMLYVLVFRVVIFLGFYVALTIVQPYLDLEAGENQSQKQK